MRHLLLPSFFLLLLLVFLPSSTPSSSSSPSPSSSSSSSSLRSDEDAVDAFEEWLEDRGVRVSPALELRPSGAGGGQLGVFALRDVRPGEVLVAAPLGAVLHDEHRKRPDDPIYASGILDAPDYCELDVQSVAMAHHLVEQAKRGKASPLWPYLRMVPRDVNLVSWDADDLAALGGSFVGDLIAKRRDSFGDFWKHVTRYVARGTGGWGGGQAWGVKSGAAGVESPPLAS